MSAYVVFDAVATSVEAEAVVVVALYVVWSASSGAATVCIEVTLRGVGPSSSARYAIKLATVANSALNRTDQTVVATIGLWLAAGPSGAAFDSWSCLLESDNFAVHYRSCLKVLWRRCLIRKLIELLVITLHQPHATATDHLLDAMLCSPCAGSCCGRRASWTSRLRGVERFA